MPPPTPVSIPSSAAMTGFSSNATPFCAPETAKSASPAASKTSTGLRKRVDCRIPVESDHAGKQRDRQISPIADRRGRNRSDQDVAGNPTEFPATKERTRMPNRSSRRVTPAVAPLIAKTKVPTRSSTSRSDIAGFFSQPGEQEIFSVGAARLINGQSAAPTTRPARRQPGFRRPSSRSDG